MADATSEHVKELVIARIEALPSNIGIAVGSDGSFNKEQLLEHVEAEDDIGKKYIELDLEFLRAFKEGKLFEQSATN